MRGSTLKSGIVVIFLTVSIFVICSPGVQAQEKEANKKDSLTTEGDAFTIIGIPDTQEYAWLFPGIFYQQFEWIRKNAKRLNLKFVASEGDVVQKPESRSEWEIADSAYSMLDGVVSWGIAIGNHDIPPNIYNEYFPYRRFIKYKWYGGHFWKTNEGNYELFEASGMKFMVVCLRFDPSILMLKWANKVVSDHPDRRVIVVTHSFLNSRKQYTPDGGQEIWDMFVRKHKNIFLVLCGHLSVGQRKDTGDHGNTVYSLLADYQGLDFGGEGWLRILRFVPEKNLIEVRTYSTGLHKFFGLGDGKYSTPAMNEFDLHYDMKDNSTMNSTKKG